MSIYDGLPTQDHTNFSGPDLLSDEEDVRQPHGLLARDIEFTTGQVRTRRGFATAFTPNSPTGRIISTLLHWPSARFNRLIYFCPIEGKLYQRNLISGAESQIVSGITALGSRHALAGYRLISSFYTSASGTGSVIGAGGAWNWDGAVAHKLFSRPLLTSDMISWTFAEPSSGVLDAGRHYFGLILTSRSGYETRPGPADSATNFSYLTSGVPTHVSAGAKNLQLTIRALWPSFATQAQLIMTPVDNPNRWFKVPGGSFGVPSGQDYQFVMTINLSDVTLTGTAITDLVDDGYFDVLSQDAAGNGPITPFLVASFNRRIVYGYEDLAPDGSSLTSALLISDVDAPERLSRARHQIYLPMFRAFNAATVVGGVLYILGPSYTYAYSDNGAYPVQWAEPRTVSGSIGTPFPEGVLANDSLNYAWVADSSGLYRLESGIYPSLPASNLQTPLWRQINFAAPPNALKIVEDPSRRLVMVAAPLGIGQSVANRLLVWDFSRGTTPDRIRFCGEWHIADGQVDIGGITLVTNPTTAKKEVWLGTESVAGPVLRQKYDPVDGVSTTDPAIYSDEVSTLNPTSVGIQSFYRFGPLFPVQTGPAQLVALAMRLRGIGRALLSVFSLDQTAEVELPSIPAMDPSPGRLYHRGCDKQSEGASFQVASDGEAGSFFILSLLRTYWQRWMEMR